MWVKDFGPGPIVPDIFPARAEVRQISFWPELSRAGNFFGPI
jgi:hypothetical protein